jgi:hypothetical protein
MKEIVGTNFADKRRSSCIRPFWIGKLSDKCLRMWTLLYISLKHILISLTSFMGTPNSMRILYCIYFPPFLLHSNTWIRHINYKSTSI